MNELFRTTIKKILAKVEQSITKLPDGNYELSYL